MKKTLMKVSMGLLAALAASSSMAQASNNCQRISFSPGYSSCFDGRSYSEPDDASMLALVSGSWGVTGSVYKDNVSIVNEASESVLLASSTASSRNGSLTFQQAVAGPFAVILKGSAERQPFFFKFDSGVAAGSELAFDGIRGNLSYAAVVGVATPAVPEPETYALALAGLGVVGWMARRRRNTLAA
jgi:PEP-CTERM motif